PVYLQVLGHGLVNRFTINYAQLASNKISNVLVQQIDAFDSTDGASWNFARRVSLNAGSGLQQVSVPAIGDDSRGWKGHAVRGNGDATTDYSVVFRASNITVITVVSYLSDPGSVDFAVHLAQLSLARIQS